MEKELLRLLEKKIEDNTSQKCRAEDTKKLEDLKAEIDIIKTMRSNNHSIVNESNRWRSHSVISPRKLGPESSVESPVVEKRRRGITEGPKSPR